MIREDIDSKDVACDSQLGVASSSPFHQVPLEIFTKIITLVLSDQNGQLKPIKLARRDSNAELQSLIGVCRSWRDTIYRASMIWSHLRISDFEHCPLSRVKILETYLARSRNSPLTIFIDCERAALHSGKLVILECLDLLLRECSRWRDVELVGVSRSYAHLFNGIKGCIPLLCRLVLCYCFNDDLDSVPIVDAFAIAPNLTCLRLYNSCSFTRFIAPWSQILHLTIDSQTCPTPNDFGTVFTLAVNMTELYFDSNVIVKDWGTRDVDFGLPSRHDCLSKLRLCWFGPLWLQVLCPNLRCLSIMFWEYRDLPLITAYLCMSTSVTQLFLGDTGGRWSSRDEPSDLVLSSFMKGAKNIKILRLSDYAFLNILLSRLAALSPDKQPNSHFLPSLEELGLFIDEDPEEYWFILEDILIPMLKSWRDAKGHLVAGRTSLVIYLHEEEFARYRNHLTTILDGVEVQLLAKKNMLEYM